MEGTIEERHGKLVIVKDWANDYSTPTQCQLVYPTNINAHDWPELINARVKHHSIYSGCYETTNGIRVQLSELGKTKPISVNTRAIKKPRWAVSWENGKWHR